MSFLHLRRDEAQTAIMCLLLLFLLVCVAVGVNKCQHGHNELVALTDAEQKELHEMDRSMQADEKAELNHYAPARISNQLFPFDPNHADSATLLRIGLRPWQISNMMKYRRHNGRWRTPDDLKRLYGLSASDFKKLRPYIRIAEADKRKPHVPFYQEDGYYDVPKADEVHYEKQVKLTEGQTLSLNTADTTAIKQIPGIGSYYARKIVNYRERMGGFVSTAQLAEVEGLPAGVSRWFKVEGATSVKTLHINHATFKELVRHPYISYEQTKVIVNHIRQYGPIHSWHDLQLYKEFTQHDFERLTPYVRFDR